MSLSLPKRFALFRGLAAQIALPVLTIFSLAMIGILVYNYVTIQSSYQQRIRENSALAQQSFEAELLRLQDFAQGLAIQAASSPDVQAAFAARDRDALREITLPSYQALDAQFKIPQYQYHTAPATSFLRLHDPEKFGDDLSSFRFTVLQVSATQKPVVGLEVGRGGVGLRAVEPVFYRGEYVGSVEFGLNVDAALVSQLKQEYGGDWRILLTRDSLSLATLEDLALFQESSIPNLLILSETLSGAYSPATAYQKALRGETVISSARFEDRTYSVTVTPLRDYSGAVVGVAEFVLDQSANLQSQNSRPLYFVLAIVGALVAGAISLTLTVQNSLRPLQTLTTAAQNIQAGDLSQRVAVTSQDEVAELGSAFNNMASQLQGFITSLERRVQDRTKALQTSLEVSRRLSGVSSARQLAVEVVEQLQAAFGYYHAHIYFFDEAGEYLLMTGGTGEAGAKMMASGHKIPRGRGLVGRAAETASPVLVEDVDHSIGWLPNPLLPETKSELAVPVVLGKQVLGVIDVQQNKVGGLTEDDVSTLQLIAAQVAISLQTTRTYERTRAQAQMESLVNSITEKIQTAQTLEDTLQITARELGAALGSPQTLVRLAPRPQTQTPEQNTEELNA